MKRAILIAQLITNAHRDSVRLLFQDFGIEKEPSVQSIIDAYIVYGEPFLKGLFEIVYNGMSQFSGIEGLEIDKLTDYANAKTEEAQSMEKSSFWDGFKNVFSNAGDILSGANNIYQSVSSMLNGSTVDTGVSDSEAALALQQQMLALQAEQAKTEEANKTKTILLVGAGVLVAALVAIMFLKK